MADNLKTRVGRIVAGSVSALLDSIEGAAPDMIMEQALREIDGAIADVQADLGKVLADRHVATRQLADKNAKHETLSDQIALAVKQGRDDLAEAGISAQLDIEAQIPVIEQSIAAASEQERELNSFITALRAKRREMADELKTVRESKKAVASKADQSSASKKVAAAENVFERMMERHGTASGLTPSDVSNAQKLHDLDALARGNRVAERLAKLKSQS
jgi:phage shock protein A